MSRVMTVARIQLVTKWTYLGTPLVILAAAFLLSIAIYALIPGGRGQVWRWQPGPVLVLHGARHPEHDPGVSFSQGLSISRRAFYLGTLGLFAVLAAAMTAIYLLGGIVERATNGWGVNGFFFNIPWISNGPWYGTAVFYFTLMMFMFIIGFWFATIYKRWGNTGMLVAVIGSAVLLLGLVALAAFYQWWGSIGAWFAQQTPLTLGAWAALLCVALAGGSYLTLRRATP